MDKVVRLWEGDGPPPAAVSVLDGQPPPVIREAEGIAGERIAWAATGAGEPALAVVSGWVTNVSLDWTTPRHGAFFRRLAQRRRLIRMDSPGVGLSDREAVSLEIDHQARNVLEVLDAAGEHRVAILGRGYGGAVAVHLAATWPERVSHLVLVATSARMAGRRARGRPSLTDAVRQLVLADWAVASRTLADLFLPGAPLEDLDWYADYLRNFVSPATVAEMMRVQSAFDVTELLPRIQVPTLVIHRRGDRVVPVTEAEALAGRIPGARLQIVEGSYHLPRMGDWNELGDLVDAFLNPNESPLTSRETELLALLEQGLHNRELAERLRIGERTVARHLANIYAKLQVTTRTAAITRARDQDLLPKR